MYIYVEHLLNLQKSATQVCQDNNLFITNLKPLM